ncbi:DUF2625 domain-containing protein [Chitinophaga sp. Cy-1792]|uniref:DUF2625 domain-containing protein n=1 Tax=Chitinophaga sp. Cy-1792 TaxID=2608339 RepID=UPI00141ECF23|nr:DUF2625 domain-containing protein [Chitinophaga sp. Cy-1792]NIG56582.1 DUF2625 domain-containing protein [Chitinophaga sp. Cy-1792]
MTINNAAAQAPKRSLEQLINTTEPAWPLVQEWIKNASNQVEVLNATPSQANETLLHAQVTTRSPMGAIILNSGGILVDHGWIRILGSGNAKMKRTLHTWNANKTFDNTGQNTGYILVADDAIGGYYAINGGGLGKDAGKAYYLDPATLQWEALDLTYSQLIVSFFCGDLQAFYKDLRWKNWEKEIATMTGDEVINCYPMLYTKEGSDINKVHRKSVPVEEQWTFTYDIIQQLISAKPAK